MATNYPDDYDGFSNPNSFTKQNQISHSEQHADANDAIEAIQHVLGLLPAGEYSTVGDRLDNASLDAEAIGNELDTLNERQIPRLDRWAAGMSLMETERVNVLVPADSMTQPWNFATSGEVLSWLELLTKQFRAFGPTTSDWRSAGRTFGQTWTSTGAAGNHGFGAQGIVLDPGEYWEDTFGGEDVDPGDAVAVYVTRQASGGANCRVLIDGVQVLAATTTTNAAANGHHKIYESALQDGEVHTVRVEASGSGTVKLDGILVHHGTLTHGLVLWNGGRSGSSVQIHLDYGGFQEAVEALDDELYLVILPSGLITFLSDNTGQEYIDGQQNAIDMVRGITNADILIIHQYEPAGFTSVSSQWANWTTVTLPLSEALASDNDAGFVSVARALGSKANQALTDKGIDVWSSASLGVDYLHTNSVGQRIIADTIWPVLSLNRAPRSLALGDIGALPNTGGRINLSGGGFIEFKNFVFPFANIPTIAMGLQADAYESLWITHAGISTVNPSTGAALNSLTWSALLDGDIGSIAALTTTSFGRALLTVADAAGLRTSAGLGALSTYSSVAGATPRYDLGQSRSTSASELSQLVATMPIDANTLAAGDTLIFRAVPISFNLSGGSVTIRLRLKVGGTTVFDSSTITIANGAGIAWGITSTIFVESISPSPIIHVDTEVGYGPGTGLADTAMLRQSTANTPVTTATTALISVDLTSQHSSAAAGVITETRWAKLTREPRY